MIEPTWPEATERLADDPDFGPLVAEVGPIRLRPTGDDPFAALARAIIYQQLAGKAAETIHDRVVGVLGGAMSAEAIAGAPEGELRDAGLSRSKLKALRNLARRVTGGELPLAAMDSMPDDEVIERLTEVWGIGPWTARMHLLFYLRRPDVWPTGDLGVRTGWARVHGRDEPPSAEELGPLGDPYRPWRSAVAWYCWRAVETITPAGAREGPGG